MDAPRKELERSAVEAATAAMQRAHAPYSEFHVGAAILLADETIFTGVNVESASYGLTLCAERSGLSAAISARGSLGPTSVQMVVIVTRAEKPTPPCGACRQWLAEFAPKAHILSVARGGVEGRWIVKDLIPDAFVQSDLT